MGKLQNIFKFKKLSVQSIEESAYNDRVLAQMADLNTETQLQEKGVFADGSDTPEYSPITVELKKLKNQRYDHMTFKDTGETLSSVRYIYNSGKLYVNWNDIHNLQSIYGNEKKRIIGLTGESINEIKDEIIENIQEKILEKK